jgi:hypothetical protein
MPGSADLCFLVETNVDDVLKGLKDRGIDVLEDSRVVQRTGAQGKINSVVRARPDNDQKRWHSYCQQTWLPGVVMADPWCSIAEIQTATLLSIVHLLPDNLEDANFAT